MFTFAENKREILSCSYNIMLTYTMVLVAIFSRVHSLQQPHTYVKSHVSATDDFNHKIVLVAPFLEQSRRYKDKIRSVSKTR